MREREVRTTGDTGDQMADVSEIDKRLNEAKTRKAQREGNPESGEAETKKTRAKLTDDEKNARKAEADANRLKKKQEREQERAVKKQERASSKKPAHLAKVEKAFNKLPILNEAMQTVFNDVTSNFSRDQIGALAAHLNHHNRVSATTRALEQTLSIGDKVRIVGGDPRFIGQEGTVDKAQRIRCYVMVGGGKRAYLFTSDVERIQSDAKQATG